MSDPTNIVVLKCEFWIRISVAVKVCLKEALLDILHDVTIGGLTKNKQQLHTLLTNFKAREEKNLKGVIKPFQWDKLCHVCTVNCSASSCPKQGQTDSDDLDITCIIVLIIHLTNLPAPLGNKGWKQILPQVGDTTKAAFVLLARKLRNELMHCSLQQFCTKQDFDDFWKRTKDILVGLGYNNMILFDDMEKSSLDPYIQKQIELLKDKYAQLALQQSIQKFDNLELKRIDMENLKQIVRLLDKNLKEKIGKAELQQDLVTLSSNITCSLVNINQTIATLNEKVEELEKRNECQKYNEVDIESMSSDLKEKTKKRFDKVNVSFAPKTSSLCCEDAIDRDDIIVDLSLITNAKTVFNMASVASDIKRISELRRKQKENALWKISYDEIVTSLDDYVIISGVPGSGKTTLIETMLHKWGSNQLWYADQVKFDFVFVIYLRKLARFKTRTDITAEQILSYYYPDFDFERLSRHKSSLLIMEGFDELSGKEDLRLKEETFTNYTRAIYDLLDPRNASLPFTRIVTSRPGSCSILLETVSFQCCQRKCFEVTGFSDENIIRYIHKHFVEHDHSQEVVRKLKRTPVVYDMMVIPFYCWGVCYLIKNDVPVEEFAQTYTALYVNLLGLFIRNHGFRNPSLTLKNILHDPNSKKACLGLAALAFRLQESGKIDFTQEDLPNEIDMEKLIQDSGMIIKIESDGISKPTTTYQFLHYTFHEFLVALHMFAKGQFIKNSKNIQIFSMLAGLLGGSLNQSNSILTVQRFCRELSVNSKMNIGDIIAKAFERKIEIIDLLPIIYEFHNIVYIDCGFLVYENASDLSRYSKLQQGGTPPYVHQCKTFFRNLQNENKIQLGTIKIGCNEYVDIDLVRILLCCSNCTEILTCSNVIQSIFETPGYNFTFTRIILFEYDLPVQTITTCVDKTKIMEVYFQRHDTLLNVLRMLHDYKDICTMKKLVIHFDDEIEVDSESFLNHADVCQEIVLGIRCGMLPHNFIMSRPYMDATHLHSAECVRRFTWDRVIKAQKTLTNLRARKEFKILKKISIGYSCPKNVFGVSTVIFSEDFIY